MKMQILIFLINKRSYSIEIDWIDTIEKLNVLTPVPKSKKEVMGVVSWRGQAITVMNTGMILNYPADRSLLNKLIIVNIKGGKLALAVTDIEDVIDIEAHEIELIDAERDISVVKVDEKILTLLNRNQLMRFC